MSSPASSTSDWWSALRTTALVGTARRPVPPPLVIAGSRPRPTPAVGQGDVEGTGTVELDAARQLLDATAVLAVARRAGRRSRRDLVPWTPAEPEDRPEASPGAVSLLELLLGEAFTSDHRHELIVGWFDACRAAGRRLPSHTLVAALDRASKRTELQAHVAAVVGERGRWLATMNPTWSWAAPSAVSPAEADPIDADEWARQPSPDRLAVLIALRARDPRAARELVLSSWDQDPAAVRVAHLATLADGPEADDEDLLERALDDRARSVRDTAVRLLDARPGSARGQRMAGRLDALASIGGKRRKRAIVIALPGDPDPAAVRDGLGPPPARQSARGWWLQRIVAGAPFTVWSALVGDDIEAAVELIGDDDVLAGLSEAAVARHDQTWAMALYRRTRHPRLLTAIGSSGRELLARERLRASMSPVELVTLLDALAAPWSPSFSTALIEHLRRHKEGPAIVEMSTGILAAGLHPDSAVHLARWLDGLDEQPRLAYRLRSLLQYQSFQRSINEAFS